MGGTSRNSFERDRENSTQWYGHREDMETVKPSDLLLDADDTVLTGATTPVKAVLTGGASVIKWAANAATTVKASWQTKVKGHYGPKVPPVRGDTTADTTAAKSKNDDLHLIATMRRERNAADNGAFSAELIVKWMNPGSATWNTLSTNPTAALAAIAADNTGDLTGFGELDFDIGTRLRTEGARIQPGAIVRFTLHVSAQYATAAMEFAGAVLRGRCHDGLTCDPQSPANMKSIRGV